MHDEHHRERMEYGERYEAKKRVKQAHRGKRVYEFKVRQNTGHCYCCKYPIIQGERYFYVHKTEKSHGASICKQCWDVLIMEVLAKEERSDRWLFHT